MQSTGRSQNHDPISPAEWAFLRFELCVCQTAGCGKLSSGFEAALKAGSEGRNHECFPPRPSNFLWQEGQTALVGALSLHSGSGDLPWIRRTRFIQSITHKTVVFNLHVFIYFLTTVPAFSVSSTRQIKCPSSFIYTRWYIFEPYRELKKENITKQPSPTRPMIQPGFLTYLVDNPSHLGW